METDSQFGDTPAWRQNLLEMSPEDFDGFLMHIREKQLEYARKQEEAERLYATKMADKTRNKLTKQLQLAKKKLVTFDNCYLALEKYFMNIQVLQAEVMEYQQQKDLFDAD